jgi:hypothetical protein
VHALKIDLAFQFAPTLNCTTNIYSKNEIYGHHLMDGPFEPMDSRFGLVAEKLMVGFMGRCRNYKSKKTALKRAVQYFNTRRSLFGGVINGSIRGIFLYRRNPIFHGSRT